MSIFSSRVNRVEKLVREITEMQEPMDQLAKIEKFNLMSPVGLTEAEQRAYDAAMGVIQDISRRACERLYPSGGCSSSNQATHASASSRSSNLSHTDRAQPKKSPSALFGRVFCCTRNYLFPSIAKVVNLVGKRNILFIGAEAGSYLFAGWTGVLATGTIFTGIIIGSSYLQRKKHSSEVVTLSRSKENVDLRLSALETVSSSKVVAGVCPPPSSVLSSNRCPISGKEISEASKIEINGKNYDSAFLIVNLLMKDSTALAGQDFQGVEIPLPQLRALLGRYGFVQPSNFYRLWSPSDPKSARIIAFLDKAKEFLGEESESYQALIEPCGFALSLAS
jgi:hypothetical protein